MKRTCIVFTEIILILATVIPVLALLWECIYTAIHGTIPWGFGYGVDYGAFIYGMEAFIYTFFFYCTFLFVLVVLWFGVAAATIGFSIFTIIYLKKNPVNDGIAGEDSK